MQTTNRGDATVQFRRRFSLLSHLLWIAVLLCTLYIAGYVLAFVLAPAEAAAQGHLLTAVPSMLEHVLMSILLLTAAGAAEESVFRGL